MTHYVCIFFTCNAEIETVISFPATDHLAAIAAADELNARREARQYGYHLWHAGRRIHDGRKRGPAPP